MKNFACAICGKEWPENYCPECCQTIRTPPTPPPLPRQMPPPLAAPARRSPPPLPLLVQKKKQPLPRIVIFVTVVFLLVAGFMGYRVVQAVRYAREHPRQASPGEPEFREANRQIIGGKSDQLRQANPEASDADYSEAFGNNPEAMALAKNYSQSLKILRNTYITQGHKTAIGLLEGECPTYCQLNDDSCVFLVHIRELRNFTSEAKKFISDAAWINAQSVLQASTNPPPKTVVVGVKGLMLYDSIMIGDYVTSAETNLDGIKTRGAGIKDMKLFYPFFVPKKFSPAPPTTLASTNAESKP